MLGDYREGTRSCLGGQVACLGDPTLASLWHGKCLIGAPRLGDHPLSSSVSRPDADTIEGVVGGS